MNNGFEYEYEPKDDGDGKKSKNRMFQMFIVALCAALVGGAVSSAMTMVYRDKAEETYQSSNELDSISDNITSETANSETDVITEGNRSDTSIEINRVDTNALMSSSEIYASNVNSTVGITTSITTNYFGFKTTSAASGSGFILTKSGYIVTNHHVIEDADEITVTCYDGTAYEAELIGYDESNDLAVLKVEAENLTPVIVGDSDKMNVGDGVVAIGNPLGELTFSLTSGVISALDRKITLSSSVTMELIQTDCAINSGNSGGALFNMYGELIGITNAKYSGNTASGEASIDNIGFAIPINDVRGIIESIIENGYIIKSYIGVSTGDLSSQAQAFGYPNGAVVISSESESPAEKAGLKANDIITEVNGAEINGSGHFQSIIYDCSEGEVLELTVYRNGEYFELEVTVEEYKQPALPETTAESNYNQIWR